MRVLNTNLLQCPGLEWGIDVQCKENFKPNFAFWKSKTHAFQLCIVQLLGSKELVANHDSATVRPTWLQFKLLMKTFSEKFFYTLIRFISERTDDFLEKTIGLIRISRNSLGTWKLFKTKFGNYED